MILDSLTVGRYKLLQPLELKFAFGASSDVMVKLCNIVCNEFDGKVDKSIVMEHVFNLRKSFIDSMTRMDAYLHYCALWTTSEGEDISELTDQQAKEKIEDWKHIDVGFFLEIAQIKVAHYIENYKETSLIISLAQKKGEIAMDTSS